MNQGWLCPVAWMEKEEFSCCAYPGWLSRSWGTSHCSNWVVGQGMPALAHCFPVPRRSRPRPHLQPGQLVRYPMLLCWWRLCTVQQVLHMLVMMTSGRKIKV